MSILDRFLSKETGLSNRKAPSPAPGRMASSELEDSAAEAKEQYPDDGKLIEDFMWALKGASRARRKKALEGDLSIFTSSPSPGARRPSRGRTAW